jgi:hypothetical protein
VLSLAVDHVVLLDRTDACSNHPSKRVQAFS